MAEPGITCAMCGRRSDPDRDGDPPLGWTAETADARTGSRWICPSCTRDHVRAIEAKLDQQWW